MNSQQTTAALTINKLSFAYTNKPALEQVSFRVKAKECAILLGPNGAGKSTLFSLITRLYDSPIKKIKICGFDLKKNTQNALKNLGVVFQQTTLDLDLSITQNLRYHTALHGMSRKIAKQRIQEELERLNIYSRRNDKIRQLSGGYKRRVEIARALLHNPSLLLLDEPTVGLDVSSRQSIVRYIHKLVCEHNLAVLWATHLIDEIYPQDQIIVLHKGLIKAQGLVSEVLKQTQSKSINLAFNKLTTNVKA